MYPAAPYLPKALITAVLLWIAYTGHGMAARNVHWDRLENFKFQHKKKTDIKYTKFDPKAALGRGPALELPPAPAASSGVIHVI
ncbi:hypothetical protein TNCV_725621 [Trichonephila clavipes]|nr:hypothetical protein TNCV_725621 [Trichonephila clavipes]